MIDYNEITKQSCTAVIELGGVKCRICVEAPNATDLTMRFEVINEGVKAKVYEFKPYE